MTHLNFSDYITHNKPHLHIKARQRGRVVNASGCYPDSLGSASSSLAVVFILLLVLSFPIEAGNEFRMDGL